MTYSNEESEAIEEYLDSLTDSELGRVYAWRVANHTNIALPHVTEVLLSNAKDGKCKILYEFRCPASHRKIAEQFTPFTSSEEFECSYCNEDFHPFDEDNSYLAFAFEKKRPQTQHKSTHISVHRTTHVENASEQSFGELIKQPPLYNIYITILNNNSSGEIMLNQGNNNGPANIWRTLNN
jgi:hypothetical protein